MTRWCTTELKNRPRAKYLKPLRGRYNLLFNVGLAADEVKRLERKNNTAADQLHPLVDWGWAEKQCLQYCKDKGFDWGGLYDLFPRVSCWCCPLQTLNELRILYKKFPALWTQLKTWDKQTTTHTFRMNYESVEQLEQKFKREDLYNEMQGKLF